MAHKPVGLIGIPCAEQARWSAFWGCVEKLERPAGWHVESCHGQSPASNRNGIIRKALAIGAEWVFFLDDDLTFRSNLLTTLLATEKKAVVALSMRRGLPMTPLWFNEWAPQFDSAINLSEVPPPGALLPIKWATAGAVLLHTSIFRAMADPWFTLGQMGPEVWNDDVHFFSKMADTGEQLYGCSAAWCGHITHVEVWPHYEAGQWFAALVRGHQLFAALPSEVADADYAAVAAPKDRVCEPVPIS